MLYRQTNARLFASSVAFFVFLAIFPTVLLVFSIIPFTPLTEAGVLHFLEKVLPEALGSLTVNIIRQLYGVSFHFRSPFHVVSQIIIYGRRRVVNAKSIMPCVRTDARRDICSFGSRQRRKEQAICREVRSRAIYAFGERYVRFANAGEGAGTY